MKKELYAVVNTKPNARFSGVHKDLTIVNRPEAAAQPAIYQESELEKAREAREQLVEQSRNEDLKVRKITVEEVEE